MKHALILRRAKRINVHYEAAIISHPLYRFIAQIHTICVVQKTRAYKFSLRGPQIQRPKIFGRSKQYHFHIFGGINLHIYFHFRTQNTPINNDQVK